MVNDATDISDSSSAAKSDAEAILDNATANAVDGIQSYTHGSRQVTRSNPRTQLEFVQDLELRERRQRFGIVMYCDQGAG